MIKDAVAGGFCLCVSVAGRSIWDPGERGGAAGRGGRGRGERGSVPDGGVELNG